MHYCIHSKKIYNSVQDYLLAHKHTSFGDMDTEEERNIFGLYLLHHRHPEYNRALQEIKPAAIVPIDGKYTQTYHVVDKVLSHEEKVQFFNNAFGDALIEHFNATAATKQYDDYMKCLMRAGYPNPWQKEAQAFGSWMDACNAKAYAIMNSITVGETKIPTSFQPFIDELPPMEWPAT